MQNSLQQADSISRPITHLALQLYKTYIRTKLEYGCIIWGHAICHKNHMKQLEGTQRGALSLILQTMKSTPLEAIESGDGNNTN